MAIKKYRIKHITLYWECEIEIDEDFITPIRDNDTRNYTTKELIKMLVEFWSGWKELLKETQYDYTAAFIKRTARKILLAVMEGSNINGVISRFKDEEGWFEMDGSYGIKITSVDEFDFDYSDFHIDDLSLKSTSE